MSKKKRTSLKFGVESALKQGPRVTTLADYFESLAAGEKGVPSSLPIPDFQLFYQDKNAINFSQAYLANIGTFMKHAISSIPFFLEEDCRLGTAIINYANQLNTKENPLLCYSVGSADGTLARTLVQMAKGKIHSLSNTPTKANWKEFYRMYEKLSSADQKLTRSYLGSYFQIKPNILQDDPELNIFKSGFDVIVEAMTFQMYSKDRTHQIKFLANILKKEGIIIFCEKLSLDNKEEYLKRETFKDKNFKSKYFTQKDLAEKKSVILSKMEMMQATEKGLSKAIRHHFRYAVMTWNSCNFYTIIASNSKENLMRFVHDMLPPCVPASFCFTELPRIPEGFPSADYSFRQIFHE